MHSPEVVIFSVNRPWPKISRRHGTSRHTQIGLRQFWYIGNREFYFPPIVTVWHNEPGGADSGTVCDGMGGSKLTWHNAQWAATHWRHLEIHVEPVRSLRRWMTDRCPECGQRFRRHEARFGYGWSEEREVYHDKCMSLRHTRTQIDDLHAYIDGHADSNQKFRVEYAQEKREARP